MEENPTAPTPAPAEASVENSTNTNPEPAAAPTVDLGLSAEQAQKFKTFIENSGGFDNAFSKLKSDISTPKSAQSAPEAQPETQPTSQPQAPIEPQYKTPAGAITAQEFLAQQYFQALSKEEKYAPISKGIADGEYLKEMSAFGINALNPDGSINDQKVRMYLDLKAQTVPAKPTGAEPGMSTAPTVEYYQVAGDKVTNMDDAYKILAQDMQLRASGNSHPLIAQAEEFIRTGGKPAEKK